MKATLLAAMLFAGLAPIPFSPASAATAMQPGAICKATLGLNPANADYDACERTLLRYQPALSADAYTAPQAVAGDIHLAPQRGWAAFEASCAELGIDPATDALGACAGDLDASLLELHLTAAE